jgi:hypothetical protein
MTAAGEMQFQSSRAHPKFMRPLESVLWNFFTVLLRKSRCSVEGIRRRTKFMRCAKTAKAIIMVMGDNNLGNLRAKVLPHPLKQRLRLFRRPRGICEHGFRSRYNYKAVGRRATEIGQLAERDVSPHAGSQLFDLNVLPRNFLLGGQAFRNAKGATRQQRDNPRWA